MTDRIKGLTVVLDRDIRDDDCQAIIDAVSMIRGVLRVEKHVMTGSDYMVREQVRHELEQKLLDALRTR